MSWLDEYNKALKKKLEEKEETVYTTSTVQSSGTSDSWMATYDRELNRLLEEKENDLNNFIEEKKVKKEEERVSSSFTSDSEDLPWYKRGLFEDGYDFGDVTKTILGISDKKELKTFTAPDTTDSVETLKQKMEEATDYGDKLKYQDQLNQLVLYQYADTLSKTKLDGSNYTVLQHIERLANMEKGEEKDKLKAKVLAKMEELGMDTEYYSHFAGDGEFGWGDLGGWASNAALAGLNTFNKGLLNTADVLLGAPLKAMGWENNPISKGAEYYTELYDLQRYNANLYAEKLGGNAWNFGTDAIEGTVGALPNALLMFMTGGTSATATTSSLTSNAAMQTGNILTKAGLTTETMMKNPQFWMSFSRTLGDEYIQAKEEGASDMAASFGSILSTLLQSGIEIGTDGGSGIQGLADELKKGKPLMALVESALEEAGEEDLQKFVGEGISRFIYGSDKEILNPIEYAKEGVLGGISGFALGGGQTVVQTGVNAYNQAQADKLTDMEQGVADKLVEKEIARRESKGKTVSNQDKKTIKKDIERNLRKGFISAEDIEEAIGGEAYDAFKTERDNFFGGETYKAMKENESRIKEMDSEIDELGAKTNPTLKDHVKFDELRQEFEDRSAKWTEQKATLDKEAQRIIGLRNQMRSQMMETVKDSRLAESYREMERKKQKFQIDVNQFSNDNAKKTVQSILDSGLGDNSNQFHETVSWLAQLSEDKNLTFDLTNNKKLKGTKHYKDGYITHGFVTDNGEIMLNMDSDRVLNTTVGHEITHVLEQAGIYEDLSKAVRDYAVSKEGQEAYQKRLDAIKEIYGEDQKKIDSELTADIIGEYLFTDYDFVQSLSTQNRNVFQKIYDEIKYLCKIATADSKEARELERVKKLFDKAYRENVKTSQENVNNSQDSVSEATIDPENDADLDYESPEKYSISVKDPETIDFLENQEHITTYKAMVLIDGKLYPPMASKVKGEDGKYHLTNGRELGEWMMAEEDTTNIKFNEKGIGYYDLKKDDGGTVRAAYNPYEHSSNLVLNDQFEAAYKRGNLVTVECVIPKSEIDNPYTAEYAKDSTGVMDWHSGVVAGKLTDNKRSVYLSRYLKAVRIVPDSEVAQMYKDIVGDLAVPFNVVSPSLLTELENVGVNIDYDGSPQYQYLQRKAAEREAAKSAKESIKILDGGSVTKYSLSTWTPEAQAKAKENLVKAGFLEGDVDKWIADTNGIAAVIASDKARLDFEAADNQVMLKDNQEYIKTLDASTLCAKRLVYQGTFDAIQHRLPNTVLSSDDLIDLLNMMKENGVQTPCGVCYVESRRRHLGTFAQKWLDTYDGEYKPRLDEVTTSDGLEALRKSHPQAYKDFVDAMSKKGSSNPKVVQLRTEYRNEIMSLTPAQIRKIEAIGGLRVQSFSDFETPHLLDMMQAVMDMSAKGLHSQAYTKVPNFAWVFGDTGIKINLSLIADGDGFDADGNLAFSSVEGMDIDEAMRLRDAYSQNVGTIIVGANDKHILACMADDRIDYIIPFHRSGWGMKELDMMGMASYTDYTYGQKEHDLNKPTKVINGVQQYAGLENLYPPDYWNYELSGKENAERYLNLCAKLGREPKFAQFLVNNGDGTYSLQPDGSTDGYWKTLIDFKMYDNDGNGAAQQKVVPNFNMEEAHRVLNEYEGGANKLPVAQEIVDKFVAKYEGKSRYSLSKDEKSKMDKDYFAAVESGDEEVQMHLVREYAKASMPDSKLVDENGNLRIVYHGTNTGDFTVFNPDYIGMSSGDDGFFGVGFYFAYSKGEASYYGAKRVIPAYLNLTNPFNFQKELRTYNGKTARYGNAPDAVALLNFADKFPDIAMHITLGAVKNGESTGKSISVFEFAKAYKDVIENKEFDYQELVNEYGETETLVTADPQVHEYEYNGETHTWRDFGFQKRFMYDHDILDVAYEYLSNAVYSYIDVPRFTRIILDNNREFTAELKNRGYDGTIQSEYGDEAVAFYPNQIKSAEPITRDADGNVIPLSKRFDNKNDDIRYSMTKAEVENAYQYDLENDDMLGAEMAVEQMANLMMPDSKIRDKNGRLIPVYHGTNAQFWEFDTSADGGKNGTAEGFGIYLSDDTEVTEVYGDRQLKMFANITKPASSSKKTITTGTLMKLIKDTCQKQAQRMVDDGEYDSVKDALFDTWVSNYAVTYDIGMERAYREVANSILRMNSSDMEVIQEVMNGMGIRDYAEAMEFYHNSLTPVTGFDGFATQWTHGATGKKQNIYLAFYSSQLKSADAVTYDDNGNVIPLSERFDPNKGDIRFSISKEGESDDFGYVPSRDIGYNDEFDNFAPIREDVAKNAKNAASKVVGDNVTPAADNLKATADKVADVAPIDVDSSPVLKRLNEKLNRSREELENNQKLRKEASKSFGERIAKAQEQLDAKKNKDTKVANNLKQRIERLKRLKGDVDSNYAKRISSIRSRIFHIEESINKYHPGLDRVEEAIERINKQLESDKLELDNEFNEKRNAVAGKDSYVSQKAAELYNEIRNLKKGVRASEQLGYLLDHKYEWSSIKSALINIKNTPDRIVNVNSEAESTARDMLADDYENQLLTLDEEYAKRLEELETAAQEKREASRIGNQRRTKSEEHTKFWEDLIGDTSTWVDMKTGLQYKTKTLRRILRNVVRDGRGSPDIRLADEIYDELETKYDHNEALLKKESRRLKEVFQELNLNHAEDQVAQMLGELRYNPETTLTEDVVNEFIAKNKGKIDKAKVNKAVKEARKLYDDLIVRVNEVLREQGFKEIPYRKGYFPHFTNPKQGLLGKIFNWKTIDNEIPTSIAGLTEMFKPTRSWQSFNKRRMGDKTDYSLYQGLDTYIHGALDWIYHIEDLQKRRSLENYIRYTHSEEGVQQRIDEILKGDYDADEVQDMINAVLAESNNPLGGLVRELMNRTNTLANKKSSMDRSLEDMTNRKVYSTLTNLNNRITSNMVVGSFSSALTNFIPMVQSWHEVSPVYTVRGLGDFVRSAIKDDGMVSKSDFLTNRLMEEEKLFQTGWDKVTDKAGIMMQVVDGITSQTVWRSKYLQNLSEGMSEAQAIRDADQFAKNLMAGRSRGNAPTIFDAKNPLAKIFTAFQLEVANQYGYMFEDVPQDSKNMARMVKGYATAFLGAYAYNALYSTLVGRDAAFDPISIIENLMKGLFDDEEEPEDVLMDFGKDVLQEVPFVGGLMGGGRVPMSSAFPYSGYENPFESMLSDLSEGKVSKEWLKPLYYLAMPVAGGQIKKTIEGLSMFSDERPISGSYTESGNLRFPVEDTFGNRVQAAMFGQYASKNARDYFDNERSALKPDQIEEFMSSGMEIQDYWDYREGLKGLDKISEQADYINSLDLPIDTKNLLFNNQSDRETYTDLTGYDNYADFEEFDWATKNPEKYEFFSEIGISYSDYKNADDDTRADYNWAFEYPQYYTLSKAVTDDILEYREYYKRINRQKADKDSNGNSISGSRKAKVINYINSLDIDIGAKYVLLKMEYESVDEYNEEIFEYIKGKKDLTFEEKLSILKTLGFGVSDDGTITWD